MNAGWLVQDSLRVGGQLFRRFPSRGKVRRLVTGQLDVLKCASKPLAFSARYVAA
jgi:hypothetical protein